MFLLCQALIASLLAAVAVGRRPSASGFALLGIAQPAAQEVLQAAE